MKKEYDFSKAERGKFFQQDATFNIPVYLDSDNMKFISKIAEKKDVDISSIVNELIRTDKNLADILA